ncbi:MAG: XdhC family protein [Candidatus Omnitrophica bacterium]|nr:XdhC family protein [Candidatus Omnitrophota bacterium]
MDPDLITKTVQAVKTGQSACFATIIEASKGTPRKIGAKMVVLQDGSLLGTIGGGSSEKKAREECLKAIKTKRSKVVTYEHFGKPGQPVCGGYIKVFIEPILAESHIVICGGGHIALPLSAIAKILNFKVTVLDNRKDFANKKRFGHADAIFSGDYIKNLCKIPVNPNTYIIIVTHGHEHDFECLKAVIKSQAAYVGVISSQIKQLKFLKDLKKLKISTSDLHKLQMPVGIDIGAQTPEEIAVSIMAEIIAVQNKDLMGTDKFKMKKIN